MTKGGIIGGKVDWSVASANSASEPLVIKERACGVGMLKLGDDPEVALAKWRQERGDRKQAQQERSEQLQVSVRQALLDAQTERRAVVREGRQKRSRNRINNRAQAMISAGEHSSNVTMGEFWLSQNRLDDDSHVRYRSSPEEPKDPDREK